jgi:hypothetical protein
MLCFSMLAMLCACFPRALAQTAGDDVFNAVTVVSPPAPANSVMLDSVVAVINGDVILGSDVLEEQRFMQLQLFRIEVTKNEDQEALDHLIDRTLILQQLKELQTTPKITDAAVNEQVADLRKHLPACSPDKCETEAGWTAVLAAHGFTPEQFDQRWRVRMLVLAFIEQRFRAGVRISKPEIQAYYDTYLVPDFKKRKVSPPPLASVSQRIDEILLQQHVNGLLQEWLNSLKSQGSVAILDPAYKQAAAQLAAADGNVEGAQE